MRVLLVLRVTRLLLSLQHGTRMRLLRLVLRMRVLRGLLILLRVVHDGGADRERSGSRAERVEGWCSRRDYVLYARPGTR